MVIKAEWMNLNKQHNWNIIMKILRNIQKSRCVILILIQKRDISLKTYYILSGCSIFWLFFSCHKVNQEFENERYNNNGVIPIRWSFIDKVVNYRKPRNNSKHYWRSNEQWTMVQKDGRGGVYCCPHFLFHRRTGGIYRESASCSGCDI